LYRIAFILITVLALALGLLVGTLNASSVALDLLWIQLEWPLGLVVLTACAAGLLLGLLMAWFFSILPLRARLRKAARQGDGFGATGPLQHIDD
jgi:lipopolysaccharide assembly protein A